MKLSVRLRRLNRKLAAALAEQRRAEPLKQRETAIRAGLITVEQMRDGIIDDETLEGLLADPLEVWRRCPFWSYRGAYYREEFTDA